MPGRQSGVSDDGQPVFDPFSSERDGIRFGILASSTARPRSRPRWQARRPYRIRLPSRPARGAGPDAGRSADLLFALGLAAEQDLARAVSGSTSSSRQHRRFDGYPAQIGNTYLLQGYSGEWFGLLHASFSAETRAAVDTEQSIALTDAFASILTWWPGSITGSRHIRSRPYSHKGSGACTPRLPRRGHCPSE